MKIKEKKSSEQFYRRIAKNVKICKIKTTRRLNQMKKEVLTDLESLVLEL